MNITKERLVELAKEHGADIDDDAAYDDSGDGVVYCFTQKMLLAFGSAILAETSQQERERCAKVCDERAATFSLIGNDAGDAYEHGARVSGAAIRAME